MAGRKPLGDQAMTPAERQARFREQHADGNPKLRFRRPADRRSRPQRWKDALAELVMLRHNRRSEAPETQNPPQRAGSVSRQAGKIGDLAAPIFPENLNRCKPFLATAELC